MTAHYAVDMRSEAVPLGGGITVAFALKRGQLTVDWRPAMPRGATAANLLPAYKRARAEFIRRVAEKTGVRVLMVDL